MTIKELIDEAARIDPNCVIKAWDRVDYQNGKTPERSVEVSVFSKTEGEGSHERIFLVMFAGSSGSRLTSDQVLRVEPGKTTLYWQARPLIEAFNNLAEHPRARE